MLDKIARALGAIFAIISCTLILAGVQYFPYSLVQKLKTEAKKNTPSIKAMADRFELTMCIRRDLYEQKDVHALYETFPSLTFFELVSMKFHSYLGFFTQN